MAPSVTPSTVKVTLTTPTSSDAEASSVTGPETAPAAGVTHATVGGCTSITGGAVVNVMVAEVVWLFAPSRALTVK